MSKMCVGVVCMLLRKNVTGNFWKATFQIMSDIIAFFVQSDLFVF